MSAPEVITSSGRVRGIATEHGAAFLGIPYAEPAVGADLFTAPRPRGHWEGTFEATAPGATALQAPYPPPLDEIIESTVAPGDDYLNVSVWTPDTGGSGLPVIAWIHGGAFVRGANSAQMYDGSAFARDGVVLIGINYRLGVPGFPVTPDAPTNLGLRDQLLGLQWVQDNVASFGGDPANVTVMGESAGGMSVATLLAMPAARGLFARAIIQSGGGRSAALPEDHASFTRAVADQLGVDPTASAFAGVGPERLLEAQTAAALELATDPTPERWSAGMLRGGFGILPVFPAIDGELLTDLPETLIASGAGSDVPLLIGTCSEEFNLWSVGMRLGAAVTEENLPALAGRYGASPDVVAGYAERRPKATPGEVFSAIITDVLFREPTLRIVEARTGRSEAAPTHVYEFDWATPFHELGACHSLDLPFVFDTLAGSNLTRDDGPQALADTMHAAWVGFAKNGETDWAPYDTGERPTRRFAANGPNVVNDPRREDRIAWSRGA